MLDTLKYYLNLIGAGLPEPQAKAHAEALGAVFSGKMDISQYKQRLKDGGVPEQQAEAIGDILKDVMASSVE